MFHCHAMLHVHIMTGTVITLGSDSLYITRPLCLLLPTCVFGTYCRVYGKILLITYLLLFFQGLGDKPVLGRPTSLLPVGVYLSAANRVAWSHHSEILYTTTKGTT